MGIFEKFLKPPTGEPPVEDPKWSRSESGHFRRFINLEPEEEGLSEKSGVFVIWHGGLRPRWVYVGASDDLAKDLDRMADDDDIMGYEVNGGLFVTWAAIRAEFQGGVVKYLNEAMDPLVENPWASTVDDEPVPVVFPGKEKKA